MPPGTIGGVRVRETAFVLAIALVTTILVVAGVAVLRTLPPGPDRHMPVDGYESPLEEVPPGWPGVEISDPRTAYLPSIQGGDVIDGPVVLASGTVERSGFTLYAYTQGRRDAAVECLGFVGFPAKGASLSAAPDVVTCADAPAVPEQQDVAFIGTGSAARPDLEANFGFVSERVDKIYVVGGENLGGFEIPTLDGLDGWNVKPFLFVPSADAGGLEVDAVVGDGMVMPLAFADICHPSSVGGTCRTEVRQELPIDSPVDVPRPLAAGSWPEVTYGGDFEPYVDHEMSADGVLDPGVVGQKTVIAYGTVQAAPWSLVAYNSRDADAPDQLNPSNDLFVTGLGGSSGDALYVTEPWSPNDFSAGRMSGDVGFDAIHGVVSPRIATVRLELDDGTVRELTLIPGPAGVSARYLVEFVPSIASGRLVAFDAAGSEVAQMCLRDMAAVSPGRDPCASP